MMVVGEVGLVDCVVGKWELGLGVTGRFTEPSQDTRRHVERQVSEPVAELSTRRFGCARKWHVAKVERVLAMYLQEWQFTRRPSSNWSRRKILGGAKCCGFRGQHGT